MGIAWRRSTVAQVETGRRALSFAEALAVAAALRVPLAEILHADAPVVVDGGMWHPKFMAAAVAGVTGDLLVGETFMSPARERMHAQVKGAFLATAANDQSHTDRWPGRSNDADVDAASALDVAAARRIEAALRLTVRPWDVVAASATLWGRTLDAERDRRTKARTKAKASARSLQAVRGLVMRQLDKELAAAIDEAADRAARKDKP